MIEDSGKRLKNASTPKKKNGQRLIISRHIFAMNNVHRSLDWSKQQMSLSTSHKPGTGLIFALKWIVAPLLLLFLGGVLLFAYLSVGLGKLHYFREGLSYVEPGDSEEQIIKHIPNAFSCRRGGTTFYFNQLEDDPSEIIYEVTHGKVDAVTLSAKDPFSQSLFGPYKRLSQIEEHYGAPTQQIEQKGTTYYYYHKIRTPFDNLHVAFVGAKDEVLLIRIISLITRIAPAISDQEFCRRAYFRDGRRPTEGESGRSSGGIRHKCATIESSPCEQKSG